MHKLQLLTTSLVVAVGLFILTVTAYANPASEKNKPTQAHNQSINLINKLSNSLINFKNCEVFERNNEFGTLTSRIIARCTEELENNIYSGDNFLGHFIVNKINSENDISVFAVNSIVKPWGSVGSLCMFKYDGSALNELACIKPPVTNTWTPTIDSIKVANNNIIVSVTDWGPNDGHCCPSVNKEITYTYKKNKFELKKVKVVKPYR